MENLESHIEFYSFILQSWNSWNSWKWSVGHEKSWESNKPYVTGKNIKSLKNHFFLTVFLFYWKKRKETLARIFCVIMWQNALNYRFLSLLLSWEQLLNIGHGNSETIEKVMENRGILEASKSANLVTSHQQLIVQSIHVFVKFIFSLYVFLIDSLACLSFCFKSVFHQNNSKQIKKSVCTQC